jgi:uncharacterized protein (DUF3084 family)
MDYFHESQRRQERERQAAELRRLECEVSDKDREIRQLQDRIASREQSLTEKDEVIAGLAEKLRATEAERDELYVSLKFSRPDHDLVKAVQS